MNRYICIHSHFYQPPRENPWLEEVELQDSAHPYHDWNERISAECYAPNAASRILDAQRRIIDIVNNYSKISFNFGPTLLSWLQCHEPAVYQAILDADKESQRRFNGHGAALAQCYNHVIMPLANKHDKQTQIIWGMRDFEYRFNRKPEGMWLPETAVDMETLEILAQQGIRFTILAPHQARGVRKIGEKRWRSVRYGKIDPKIPYLCLLPSGKSIVLFFYDGPVSQEIAFSGLLDNGEQFAHRLQGLFIDNENPQLAHIATDGETYGHHHRYGEMALSYCLYLLEKDNAARITIYGQYLEQFPPAHEVRIYENSSWSCIHGVQRWCSDCGCNSGTHPGWNQQWRQPLREALDWLRDHCSKIYQDYISRYLNDSWQARDEYIEIVLNRSHETVDEFISRHAFKQLEVSEKVNVLKLLEMQRNAMLMYTSCGWFFDEISGIETVQILQYAARALQLAKEISGNDLEEAFKQKLQQAPSNIAELKNGAGVYEQYVKPAIVSMERVGAHYAVSSLFEEYPDQLTMHQYTITRQFYDVTVIGKQKVIIGDVVVHSDITWQQGIIRFAVLHLGDHNIIAGVSDTMDDETFQSLRRELAEPVSLGDISQIMKVIESYFEGHRYTLWDLFKDQQRTILHQILDATLQQVELSLRQINESNYPIIQIMLKKNVPLPKVFAMNVALMLNNDLRHLLDKESPEIERIKTLVADVKRWNIDLDRETLSFVASQRMISLMDMLTRDPDDITLLSKTQELMDTLSVLDLPLKFWKLQNMFFSISKNVYPGMQEQADEGQEQARQWVDRFRRLGVFLRVKID